jgi:xanthine dehydrogenase YagS FAD-binding subunit
MEKFSYASPATLKEATALMGSSWDDAQILAGGTDLLSLMKEHLATPKLVVNVKNIKELGGIAADKNGVRIGATVTFDELSENALIRKQYPALTQAALGITSPQIRNMGTVAGDLCQRPRCWYYRQGHGLLAMNNGKSLIPAGENRYHAIFGNAGPAYFVSPSSLAPALIALGATVHVTSPSGSRDVAASDFFVSPKDETSRETVLQPNEIVTSVHVPAVTGKSATYEIRERGAIDWPLAAASVVLKKDGPMIVLGHVAPTPWPAPEAGKFLAGKSITEETATEAAALALQGATPLSQNHYKVQLAKVCVKRALLAAAHGA